MSNSFLQQKWLPTAKGNICYFLSPGLENKPTVIFLLGLSSNHTTWNVATQTLRKFGLSLILPDLRGHGHSDKTKKRELYKFSVFTEDLKEIVEREKLSRIILVGYSFGGYVALDYVTKYPDSVSALILISTNHVNPLRYRKIEFLTWPVYGLFSFFAWLLLWQKKKEYYYFDQENAKGYWDSTIKGFTTMPISLNLWMLSEAAYLDFSQDIAKISCPTLIVKSKSDPFLSSAEARDMANKIKFSQLIALKEKSHFLAYRYQEKISETIINFLREQRFL